MTRIAVLVSGSGTNLAALIAARDAGELEAELSLVVSNKPGVKALDRARAAGIPTEVIDHKRFGTREAFDSALKARLEKARVDYVVLAGFMRLLTPSFLDAFAWRVINIHPALLPSFPGVRAQAQAVNYGVRVTGCTVHFVDAGTDTGPIIAQAVVPVWPTDDPDSLTKRLIEAEHRLLPRVVRWAARGWLSVETREGARPRVAVRGLNRSELLDTDALRQPG